MSFSDDVFIIGVGRTTFTRDKHQSVRDLTKLATQAALADAGVWPQQLSAAFFSNAGQGALEGQHMIRGQVALRHAGIERIPIINVENACASASTALQLAVTAIRAGEAEIVLAVGAERLAMGDGERSKSFFYGALDVGEPDTKLSQLTGTDLQSSGENADRSIFMDVYAGLARAHMDRYGTTHEQLASVASKNRSHAALNPNAQIREPMSIAQVLAAREIVWPLTLPMCAPLGNGAAAAIVCSGATLSRFPEAHPVRIAAICIGSGSSRDFDDDDARITHLLSKRAFELAGMGPEDISIAEVHDATAAGEIIQVESLGLVAEGDGGRASLAGETSLGGRIPVNLSGGLECNGHPVGATGLAQVHEVVVQLRNEAGPRQQPGARIGLVENGGGFIGVEEAAASVALLERWQK